MKKSDFDIAAKTLLSGGVVMGTNGAKSILYSSLKASSDSALNLLREDSRKFIREELFSRGFQSGFVYGEWREFGYDAAEDCEKIGSLLGKYQDKWVSYNEMNWDARPIKRNSFDEVPGDRLKGFLSFSRKVFGKGM